MRVEEENDLSAVIHEETSPDSFGKENQMLITDIVETFTIAVLSFIDVIKEKKSC